MFHNHNGDYSIKQATKEVAVPASTTIEVVGIKQTINGLRKIDPQ